MRPLLRRWPGRRFPYGQLQALALRFAPLFMMHRQHASYSQPLVARLSECGTVVALSVSDIGSYMQINPDSLVAQAARSYVDGLIDGGFRDSTSSAAPRASLRTRRRSRAPTVGSRSDRRQARHRRGLDGSGATTPASPEDHLVEHSRRAFACGAPSSTPCITIVGMRGQTDSLELLAERWRTVSLGKVDIVVGEADRILAEFFGPDGHGGASQ